MTKEKRQKRINELEAIIEGIYERKLLFRKFENMFKQSANRIKQCMKAIEHHEHKLSRS